MSKLSGTEWSEEKLATIWTHVAKTAKTKYKLDWYEPQFEIVNEEGMLHAQSTSAIPVYYDHWSIGKDFIKNKKEHEAGRGGLAFEVIINSNPTICYLLESNTLMCMVDVIAHAAIGHSSFFKHNYLFKEWTDASIILPFTNSARNYILECEAKYGEKEVEALIDILHSVSYISFDLTRPPKEQSKEFKREFKQRLEDDKLHSLDYVFDSLRIYFSEDKKNNSVKGSENERDQSPNFLRMILKHGNLEPWKKNIIKIFLYLNQYWYPQIQTKVMNEGWATFWDYTITKDLYDDGIVTEGMMLENLHTHTAVCYQAKFSGRNRMGDKIVNPHYRSVNPYHLGFSIFSEIKRVCLEQDEESLKAVPCLKDADWLEAVTDAMMNYKDDSFINQYLTPKLVRELGLAELKKTWITKLETEDGDEIENTWARIVTEAKDDGGFDEIRRSLAAQYSLSNILPSITTLVDLGDISEKRRTPDLYLITDLPPGTKLYDNLDDTSYRYLTMKNIRRLWKADVKMMSKEKFNKGEE
jgi:stage V sporulation protein R